MSDLQDSFNENDGMLNAMGHMAAISQRNRQIAQQKEQAEAIRKQTEVLEASNRIEADRAEVEKQRLKIEKQRLLADEAEREMRRQQAEQVRQLRNLMVDSMETLESVKISLAAQSIDDALKEIALRKTAALQAQLKILDSQSDILTEMSDMKELRVLRSNLSEFIGEQSTNGNLPDNPLAMITVRLASLKTFFVQSDKELHQLLGWKADWLNQFPKVSLAELHQVKTELAELKNHLPSIQERLRSMLNPLDWCISGGSPDLHQELRICAELMPREEIEDRGESTGGIILPGSKKSYRQYLPQSGSCADKYEFAHSAGASHDQVIGHLGKVDKRIDELICMHEKHHALLVEAEAHLASENFRSAERVVKIYDNQRFPDIEYNKVDSLLQRQLTVWKKFADLDAQVNASNFKESRENLRKIDGIDIKSGSELQVAVSILSKSIKQAIDTHDRARKKSLTKSLMGIFILVVAIVSLSSYVRQELKKEKMDVEKAKVAAKFALDKFKKEHQAGEENTIDIIPGISMTFCFCPAGEFFIKTPKTDADRHSNESQIKITITKGYWMTKTEVTNSQWLAVMGYSHKGDNFPVEEVSWDDTQDFLLKLNTLIGSNDGGKMVLPTEAQWQYACLAGESGPFSGGTIDDVAWYADNSSRKTHSVARKRANAWGLHDMHGNVSEWCHDWYDDELRGGTDTQVAGYGSRRVNRGGCWYSNARECRADYRSSVDPGYIIKGNGFRVVRIITE
jgi:formylglycine-generating enzyme required for sulfatase activity